MKHIKEIELPVKIIGTPSLEFEEHEHTYTDENGEEKTVYTAGKHKWLPLQFETDEVTLNYIISNGNSNYKIRLDNGQEYLIENAIFAGSHPYLNYHYLQYESARLLNF